MRRLVLILLVAAVALLVGCGPSVPVGALDDVDALSGGEDMACARRRDGSMWCWGDATLTGTSRSSAYARPVQMPGIEWAVGFGPQVCVILQDESVACSEAGFGLFHSAWAPVPPRGMPEEYEPIVRTARLGRVSGLDEVEQVGVGTYIDCARRRDGTVACWGDAAEVIRTGTYDRTRPTGARVANGHFVAEAKGLPPIKDLSVGSESALAIGRDGSVWTVGGFGRGVVRVAGIDDAVEGASGQSFHCVRRRERDVLCWRDGAATEALGKVSSTPARVDIPPATRIAAGHWGACAILLDGGTACWGADRALTQTHTSSWLSPVRVEYADRLHDIVVGAAFACGLDPSSHVLCWGDARRLGMGYEGPHAAVSPLKAPKMMAFVQLGPAGEMLAQSQRSAWFASAAALVGVLLAVGSSRRLVARATEVWRRVAGTPLVAGAGYRASEIAVTRDEAPRLLRLALTLSLVAAGADTAFVVVLDRLTTATGKTVFFVGALGGAVWIVLIAVTVAAAAAGSARALRRWAPLGVLGLACHLVFGYFAVTAQYEVGWLLAGQATPLASTASDVMNAVLLLASALGIAAACTMLAAARLHRELVPANGK